MAEAAPLDRLDLPYPRTRLIGREAERASACASLIEEATPLLSLTGPGGVGKTRLALAIASDVAEHFADGVAWVDLAPIRDPALVVSTVAAALGITPSREMSVEIALVRYLRPRQLLLFLDNCEHLLAGVGALVADLLSQCSALQILASSRAPLRVRGERILPVDPLSLPSSDADSLAAIAGNDAVRLFVERARDAWPAFRLTEVHAPSVAAICRALDGLPLAIELAAARITVLSPHALLAQMTHRLALLRDGPRDAPTRQQTLTATISWSYDLLNPTDQELFRRLTVFRGGFTLAAAQAVTGEPSSDGHQHQHQHEILLGLGRLIDHSLIYRMDVGDDARFSLLETIRDFGAEQLLASGEATRIRHRHAAYFRALIESLDARVAAYLPQSQEILDHLEAEYPNVRTALTRLRDMDDAEGVLDVAANLNFFWQLRGHLRDGRDWLEWGLGQNAAIPDAARAHGQLALAGVLAILEGPIPALPLCEASLAFYRGRNEAPETAQALVQSAALCLALNDADRTTRYIELALGALADLEGTAWAERAACHVRWIRGVQAKDLGDFARSEAHLREVIAMQQGMARQTGKEQPHAAGPHLTLGSILHCRNELENALEHYQAALEKAWKHQIIGAAATTLARIAGMLALHGRWQEAAWLFGATEAYCDRVGYAFTPNVWRLTRAFGLPQPWQGETHFTGRAVTMWEATVQRLPDGIPPLPDPVAAAEIWEAGRALPMAEAVSYALTVDVLAMLGTTPHTLPATDSSTNSAKRPALTRREHDVLTLLCQRRTNAEIADHLFLSPRTVEDHVSRLLGKLQVTNRRDAAAQAARLGLITRNNPHPFS